ncbi:MAG: nucleotidyltransferase family protein [Acidobacteriota bacterium]
MSSDAFPFDLSKLNAVLREHGVAWAGLFGSAARGDMTDESDIDLLVDFAQPKSLVAVIGLENALSATLGRQVDLVTKAALSPYLRDRVLSDLRVVYEA